MVLFLNCLLTPREEGKQTTVADNIVAKAFDKTLKVSDIKNIIELSKNSSDSIEYIRNY